MTDNSNTNWYAHSDKMLCQSIGQFIKHHRTEQQLTQQEVADKANISRSTLSLLERGETVTVTTLLQVLRVMNLLSIMDSFVIPTPISPIALAKAQQQKRQRVRKTTGSNKQSDSEW